MPHSFQHPSLGTHFKSLLCRGDRIRQRRGNVVLIFAFLGEAVVQLGRKTLQDSLKMKRIKMTVQTSTEIIKNYLAFSINPRSYTLESSKLLTCCSDISLTEAK